MEDNRELDADNENDLFALHYVFANILKNEIMIFTDSWNNHGIRTEGTKHQHNFSLPTLIPFLQILSIMM